MITIGCKSLAPLCKDYEFVVNDKNQLAELIAMLVMGWSRHVSRLIKNLDPHYPDVDRYTIQSQLDVLNGSDTTKIDGWLFQMISQHLTYCIVTRQYCQRIRTYSLCCSIVI